MDDNYDKNKEWELTEEHKKILDERLESIENGTAEFVSWEEVKEKWDIKP